MSDLTALGHLDQYHYGGVEANDHVIELLGIDDTVHCLDIGSGIGGPARYIASRRESRSRAWGWQSVDGKGATG